MSLKSSLRFFTRNKVSSIINITGLSVGLASCIIIFLFVNNEFSFDDYHSKKDRLYRVVRDVTENNEISFHSETPFPLAKTMRLALPDLENIVNVYISSDRIVEANDQRFLEDNILFANPEILQMMDFQFLDGSSESSLSNGKSAIISQSMADKYFPDENAIGKVIHLESNVSVIISAIVADAPANTHLPYSMIISIESLTNEFVGTNYDRWSIVWGGMFTYVLLPENYTPEQVENTYKAYYVENVEDETQLGEIHFRLQPFKDIHFESKYTTLPYTTNKNVIYIVILIGVFILFIACINFINLSLAQALKRSREVGLRKVIGADKIQLIWKYLSESYIITAISVVLAVILSEIIIPLVNEYIGLGNPMSIYSQLSNYFFIIILFIMIGFLAGFYPSLVISGFKPIEAIRNKMGSHKQSIRYFKNSLIVLQFIISQILIIGTILISLQLSYVKNTDLGFDSSSIIKFPVPNQENAQTLKNDLLSNANILNFTQGISSPMAGAEERFTSIYYKRGEDRETARNCETKGVDLDYLKTFNIELLSGEWDIFRHPDDSIRKIVVNEKMVSELGFKNNLDVLGTVLNYGMIVGVVEDFHMETFHEKINPLVILYFPRFFGLAYAKVNPNNMQEAIAHIEECWTKNYPESFFSYEILDEYLNSLYFKENQLNSVIRIFSIVAIILASLGLFGLISYILIQKTKEIGIRRVLGAKFQQILSTLSKDYLILIILSSVVAWPISWIYLDKWLNQFAYRIDFPLWILAFGLFVSVFIALVSVSYQAVKAFNTNPIDALKYE